MKQATTAWVEKAEEDHAPAHDLLDRPQPVFLNAAAFHAQQCVEKYLKACLQEREIPFPRTHDLDALAALLDPRLSQLVPHRERLQWLTTYAVDIRYPGADVDRDEATAALQIASDIRALIRQALGLLTQEPKDM
jgi:HEPN domain-containing protein